MKLSQDRIWIWVQDSVLYKARYRSADRSLIVYNDQDEAILTYTGVSTEQLMQLEKMFVRVGAKQLPNRTEPFTYL